MRQKYVHEASAVQQEPSFVQVMAFDDNLINKIVNSI